MIDRWSICRLAGLLAAVAAGPAAAAEIQLRPAHEAVRRVVLLADLAEVHANDAAEARALEATEVLSAPAAGEKRYVKLREVQDLLALRGVDLREHCFSGASQVLVSGGGASRLPQPAAARPITTAQKSGAVRAVRTAVLRCLEDQGVGVEAAGLEIDLSDEQARAVIAAQHRVAASAEVDKESGQRAFHVTVGTAEKQVQFPLAARVSAAPQVVTAVRSLPRGAIVHKHDVQLVALRSGADASGFCRTIDEVVGLEVAKNVVAGQAVPLAAVQPMLLVRRGEVVTVWARGNGVRVRTSARARDDGAEGDLVAVEALANRTAFLARVCGIQELEVYAGAVRAEAANVADKEP